tara:strand:+ start:1363 stop:1671 length:309 start_codon:yes stop_codon:yes gene_type:complete
VSSPTIFRTREKDCSSQTEREELCSGLLVEYDWGTMIHSDNTIARRQTIHFNDKQTLIKYWLLMGKGERYHGENDMFRKLTITEREFIPVKEYLAIIEGEEE